MPKQRGNSRLRFLDAAIGIPVVLVCGWMKRRRRLPSNIRSIGLLRTSCIGDTILLSGIIADLRERYPQARLTFFVGDTNYQAAQLVAAAGALDEIKRIPVTSPLQALRILRSSPLDVLIDFGPWPRIDALLGSLSGARCTIGFRTPGQFRHYCYDIAVRHAAKLHEFENYRRLIRVLDVRPHYKPHIEAGGGVPSFAPKGDYVVFHLWPGGFMSWVREWPSDRWAALARHVLAEGYSIVFTGTASDVGDNEKVISRIAAQGSAAVENVAGKLNLAQTAQLLKSARAVVSVNTGVMHLAAALGTPTVGLNGPTSSLRWGPLGDRAVCVEPDAEGCGYLNLGFEYKGQRLDCMEHIPVEKVFNALREVRASAERA